MPRPSRPAVRRALVALACSTLATSTAAAQRTIRSEGNAWLSLNGDLWMTPTLGLQTEVLYERSHLGEDPQSMELRLGLQRALGASARLAIGGTLVHTSPYGPFPARRPFNEYRTWVQATVDQRLHAATLTHRYRLEERWIQRPSTTGGPTDVAFALRLRYQFRATVPLTSAARPRGTYLGASDEVFLVGGPHASLNLLDQNRAYVGVGMRWSPALRSEMGYLNQAILRANGTQVENNHTLQLTFNVTRPAPKR